MDFDQIIEDLAGVSNIMLHPKVLAALVFVLALIIGVRAIVSFLTESGPVRLRLLHATEELSRQRAELPEIKERLRALRLDLDRLKKSYNDMSDYYQQASDVLREGAMDAEAHDESAELEVGGSSRSYAKQDDATGVESPPAIEKEDPYV